MFNYSGEEVKFNLEDLTGESLSFSFCEKLLSEDVKSGKKSWSLSCSFRSSKLCLINALTLLALC